ncbi:MAG: GNAT family N-acetyltransferase [Desulfovibrio sp.]|nr:GNAT family N-acetyltransferase [Desulfovibrio sp.]
MAVALPMQNQHIGSLLLFDALRRSCANELAWAVFLTEAKNDRAAAFYEKFGFLRLQHAAHSLWISRKQAERLICFP